MRTTHRQIIAGLAAHAADQMQKTASIKTAASRRWLEDQDLVKLCKLCKTVKKASP